MLFYKFLLKWGKMKKMLSSTYSLKLKNIILFLNRGLYFVSNGHIRNVVSTLPNVVKINVENDNVVSMLLNVVEFNVEKHNVVSTLLYIVNFNVDIHNVVSTLIWRCATSQRHINLKTTLNRRWNVCWGFILISSFCNRYFKIKNILILKQQLQQQLVTFHASGDFLWQVF